MQAIEFVTKAKDGVMEIPREHLKTLRDEFRVIILLEPQVAATKKKKKLSALKVKTKGLVFN